MILHELLGYDTLRLIWWVLIGVLLIAFAVMDGFDLGTAALLPLVARDDLERRVVINTIGPVWEGNQVWLILGAGAIFAAWPILYAVSFSMLYLPMFAVLLALILRPVGFKYRSKREDPRWRNRWDRVLVAGGVVPAVIFGIAVGNVLLGLPYRFDADLRIVYGGFGFSVLHPFALLCGLLSLAMLVTHGAAWLTGKTEGPIASRARRFGSIAALVTLTAFAAGGAWIWIGIDGHRIAGEIATTGISNPLAKSVILESGGWFANYRAHPGLLAVPLLGFLGTLGALLCLRLRLPLAAWLSSAAAIAGIIATVGVSLFPFLLPSSLDPRAGLTVWDASSSHLTLFVMLVVSAMFLPLIAAYTAWVYRVLRGKVDPQSIRSGGGHAY